MMKIKVLLLFLISFFSKVSFAQNEKDYREELNYDAMMYIVGHNDWIKTSIIPIKPNLMNFEIWNDVIITLVLDNWRIK